MKVWKPSEEEVNSTKTWGDWEHGPAEFPWEYDARETCYILQGHATVLDEYGKTIEFKAGDMVQFDQGLQCTWKIHETIRKKFRFD